MFVSK